MSITYNAIQNDGIMSQAQSSAEKFNQAQGNEQGVLGGYEADINKYFDSLVEYVPQGREGQTVQYDSNNDGTKEEWIILTDRNGLVEIVSKNAMGSLTLGSSDTNVTVTADLNGDGTVDYKDTGIASYNNAITTINNYCKSLVTATNNGGVRSVGGTNNNYTAYHSNDYDNWVSATTVDLASGDEYYKRDFERMQKLGIVASNQYYWMASRCVTETSSTSFNVWSVKTNGELFADDLCGTYYSGGIVGGAVPSTYAVRPVVINPVGI